MVSRNQKREGAKLGNAGITLLEFETLSKFKFAYHLPKSSPISHGILMFQKSKGAIEIGYIMKSAVEGDLLNAFFIFNQHPTGITDAYFG